MTRKDIKGDQPSGGETTWTNTGATRYGRGQHKTGSFGDDMLRPSPNHGTQRLSNDDDDDDDDMVESKNDEEKLGMPQRQHCHETLFDARLCRYMCSCPCTPCGTIGRMYRSTLQEYPTDRLFAYVAWEFGWSRIGSDVASIAHKYRRQVQIHKI